MKKLVTLILVLALVVTAFGCAAAPAETPAAEEPAKTEQPAAETPAAEEAPVEETAAPAEEAQPYTIAMILPISGALASVGLNMKVAIEHCLDYFLNEVGGFQNKNVDVKLVTLDFENDPDLAVTLYEREVNNFDAALGCYKTTATVAITALATKYEKPFMNILSTADRTCELDSNYCYRATCGDTEAVSNIGMMFDKFQELDDHPYTGINMLITADDMGAGQRAAMTALAEARGWKVLVDESLQPGQTTDASTVINKIKSSGADFTASCLAASEAVVVQRQYREYKCEVPVYTSGSGYFAPTFFENVQGAGDWVVCGGTWCKGVMDFSSCDRTKLEAMFDEMTAEMDGVEFGETGASAWLGMGVLLQAIDNAASLDPKDVAEALNQIDLPSDHFSNIWTCFAGVKFEDIEGTTGTAIRYNQNKYATCMFAQSQDSQWRLVYMPGQEVPNNPMVWPHAPYSEENTFKA